MSFVRKVTSTLGMDVGSHAVTFVLRLLLAGLLGPYNYGLFSLLMLIPEYSTKLGRFGVDEAAIYSAGKKKYPIDEILVNLCLTTFLLSLIPIALFLWKGNLFFEWILKDRSVPQEWIWIVLVTIPCFFLILSVSKFLIFLERVLAYNALVFLLPLFSVLIGVLSIVLFRVGLIGVLISYAISYSIACGIGIGFLFKQHVTRLRFNSALIRQLFQYGLKIYIPNVAQYLHYRIDTLLVAYFLSPSEVGYYSLAVTGVEVLRKIPNATSALFYPRISKLYEDEAISITTKICRHIFFLSLLLSIPFYLFMNFVVIPLLGKAYDPVLIPMFALLPGIVGVGITQILMLHYYGQGNPGTVFRPVLVGLLINIAMNLLFIPTIGILGAALASTLSYSVSTFLLLRTFGEGTVFNRQIFLLNKNDFRAYREIFRLTTTRSG